LSDKFIESSFLFLFRRSNVVPLKTLFGIIGHNISYTLSPAIYNYLFIYYSLPYNYNTFDIRREQFHNFFNNLNKYNLVGLNITNPYKSEIKRIFPDCQLDSVNTIRIENGNFVFYSTDGLGLIKAIRQIDKKVLYNHPKVIILGAGGVVPSIIIALKTFAKSILILNRTFVKAKILAEKYNVNSLQLVKRNMHLIKIHDIVINAISEKNFVVERNYFTHSQIVIDLKYYPQRTEFLKVAEQSGAKIQNGLPMLIHQAIEAFCFWLKIRVLDSDYQKLFDTVITMSLSS